MFPIPILFLSIVALSSATPTSKPTCPHESGPKAVRARLPPAFAPDCTGKGWFAPPTGWYFQPWNLIHSSNPSYGVLRNLQYDPTPLDPSNPTGLINDLFSFQVRGNTTIYTTYGVDTPHPVFPEVLNYNATGIIAGATSQYSMLAWGCDANSIPYYVSYSTATELTKTPAAIDILSTTTKGPDTETVEAIVKAVKGLGNDEFTRMVGAFQKITHDGQRDGMPRAVCDAYCKTNRILEGLLSSMNN